MTRRNVVGPIRFDRECAEVAEVVIRRCVLGVNLDGTFLAALPALGRKLSKALQRRRTDPSKLVLWTLQRDEAEAGYRFLMAFSHEDAPGVLTMEAMDAVHEVALDLAFVLTPVRGQRSDAEAVDARLEAWERPREAKTEVPDERWVRRVKQQRRAAEAFWAGALREPRPPLDPLLKGLLSSEKITGN